MPEIIVLCCRGNWWQQSVQNMEWVSKSYVEQFIVVSLAHVCETWRVRGAYTSSFAAIQETVDPLSVAGVDIAPPGATGVH